jgi:hypothetical protein
MGATLINKPLRLQRESKLDPVPLFVPPLPEASRYIGLQGQSSQF